MIDGKIIISVLFIFALLFSGCGKKSDAESNSDRDAETISETIVSNSSKPKVTFIELGSDKCVPCKMMQPVMKAIEREFGSQVEIIFYDVWKDNAPAKKYGIKLIPTQIFLDANGDEFFRHEGFFPKKDIEKLLINQGLKNLDQK